MRCLKTSDEIRRSVVCIRLHVLSNRLCSDKRFRTTVQPLSGIKEPTLSFFQISQNGRWHSERNIACIGLYLLSSNRLYLGGDLKLQLYFQYPLKDRLCHLLRFNFFVSFYLLRISRRENDRKNNTNRRERDLQTHTNCVLEHFCRPNRASGSHISDVTQYSSRSSPRNVSDVPPSHSSNRPTSILFLR